MSDISREKVSEWFEQNIFSKGAVQSTWDFEVVREELREKLCLSKYAFIKRNGDLFISNMTSALELVTVPFEVWSSSHFDLYKLHLEQMSSGYEALGKLMAGALTALRNPSASEINLSPEETDPIRSKAISLRNAVREKDADAILEFVKGTIVDTILEKPELMRWSEKLFQLSLCSMWSSYEVLSEDLWVDLVNNSPIVAKNVCKSRNSKQSESKKIDLDLLFKFDLNLNNKMGLLLKDRFDFTSDGGIRAAFAACTPPNQNSGDKDESGQSKLFSIEQKRHVILHHAGVVDERYSRKFAGKPCVGDKLIVNMDELTNSFIDVFTEGSLLLARVEQLLAELSVENV